MPTLTTLSLLALLATAPPPTAEPASSAHRILATSAGGSVGLLVGGGLGYLGAHALGCAIASQDAWRRLTCTELGTFNPMNVLGLATGAFIGIDWGVTLGGALVRSFGIHPVTTAGVTAGAVLGIGAMWLTYGMMGEAPAALTIAGFAGLGLMWVGGVLGHEIGHRVLAPRPASVVVLPSVGADHAGVMMAGHF